MADDDEAGGDWPDVPERFEGWLTALERFDRDGKQPGKKNGPIGYVGVRVAEEIAKRAGRDDQLRRSIVELARRVGHARSAVEEAVARLRKTGFIDYVPGVRGRLSSFRPRFP